MCTCEERMRVITSTMMKMMMLMTELDTEDNKADRLAIRVD